MRISAGEPLVGSCDHQSHGVCQIFGTHQFCVPRRNPCSGPQRHRKEYGIGDQSQLRTVSDGSEIVHSGIAYAALSLERRIRSRSLSQYWRSPCRNTRSTNSLRSAGSALTCSSAQVLANSSYLGSPENLLIPLWHGQAQRHSPQCRCLCQRLRRVPRTRHGSVNAVFFFMNTSNRRFHLTLRIHPYDHRREAAPI